MSTQSSKAALRGQEKADFVAASTASFQDRTTEELTKLYAEVVEEGESMPDLALLQKLDARLLARWAEKVLTADRERLVAVAERKQSRLEARELADSIRLQIRSQRDRLAAAHGKAVLAVVGVDKTPASKPLAVLRQAENVRARLLAPELELPPPRPGRTALQPSVLAAELDSGIQALDAALARLTADRKRGDQSLIFKHRALAALRRRYVGLTRLIEGRYRLADLPEAAERLRLTRRRPPTPGEPEPPEPEPPGEPEPPTEQPT
jgi:hypothetical protein